MALPIESLHVKTFGLGQVTPLLAALQSVRMPALRPEMLREGTSSAFADPASVLMIEEPETGVHPGLLRKLVQLLRDMTTGAHGARAPTQVILTTHSPMLLDLIEPGEIRIFQRGEDGATTITPFADAPGLDKLLDYQGPGEIWVNQGEAYLTRRAAAS